MSLLFVFYNIFGKTHSAYHNLFSFVFMRHKRGITGIVMGIIYVVNPTVQFSVSPIIAKWIRKIYSSYFYTLIDTYNKKLRKK